MRDEFLDCLKIISMAALLNDNLYIGFNDLCKQSSEYSQIMLTYNKLTVASSFYFFAAYLKTKLSASAQFKKMATLVTN